MNELDRILNELVRMSELEPDLAGGKVTHRGTVLGTITSVEHRNAPDGSPGPITVSWIPNDAGREWLDRARDGLPDDPATEERAPRTEQIDHPTHYGGIDDPYEPIKIIAAQGWIEDFCKGNALKYLLRAGRKPGEPAERDLRKAAWYLTTLADQHAAKTDNTHPTPQPRNHPTEEP